MWKACLVQVHIIYIHILLGYTVVKQSSQAYTCGLVGTISSGKHTANTPTDTKRKAMVGVSGLKYKWANY